MDFDNRKVYGDTSITDGLVLNSYCHELLDYVWFYQLATPLSSDIIFELIHKHSHIHTHTISTLDNSGIKCKFVQQVSLMHVIAEA